MRTDGGSAAVIRSTSASCGRLVLRLMRYERWQADLATWVKVTRSSLPSAFLFCAVQACTESFFQEATIGTACPRSASSYGGSARFGRARLRLTSSFPCHSDTPLVLLSAGISSFTRDDCSSSSVLPIAHPTTQRQHRSRNWLCDWRKTRAAVQIRRRGRRSRSHFSFQQEAAELFCQSLDTSQSDLSEGCVAVCAHWVWRCASVAAMSVYQMADGILSVANKNGAEGHATMVVRWGRIADRRQTLRTSCLRLASSFPQRVGTLNDSLVCQRLDGGRERRGSAAFRRVLLEADRCKGSILFQCPRDGTCAS